MGNKASCCADGSEREDEVVAQNTEIRLSREQNMEWVKLSRAALQARTWANPMCTKEIIFECDRKIRESQEKMRRSPEGQAALGKMMKEAWIKVSPKGSEKDRLGWE